MTPAQAKKFGAQIKKLGVSKQALAQMGLLGAYLAAANPGNGAVSAPDAAKLKNASAAATYKLLAAAAMGTDPDTAALTARLIAFDPLVDTLATALQAGAQGFANLSSGVISAPTQANLDDVAASIALATVAAKLGQ